MTMMVTKTVQVVGSIVPRLYRKNKWKFQEFHTCQNAELLEGKFHFKGIVVGTIIIMG